MVFLCILVIVVASVALSGLLAGSSATQTYTINGLTCPISSGDVFYRLSNDTRIVPAVEQVIQSSKFLAGTKGLPYGFYSVSLDTVGPTYFNGTTTPGYTALELGFATYGVNTPCFEQGGFLNWIDVEVPLVNGTFNVAAETVTSMGPPR